MAETLTFDPASLGAEPVEFDPSSLGAEPVDSFDPTSLGAQPVEETSPTTASNLSSVALSSAAKGGLDILSGATRIAQNIPLIKMISGVAKEIGGTTSQEFLTELEGAASRSEDEYGVDPKQKGFLVDLARGAGSILPAAATGSMAPIANALMMGEQGFQDAEQAGGSDLQKATSFIGGAAVGAISEQRLGIPALLKSAKAAKIPEKTFKAIVGTVVKQMGINFGREGFQETGEQIAQDTIAAYIAAYDPDRKIFDGKKLLNTFLVGGVVGTAVGGVVQAAVSVSPEQIAPKEEMQREAAQIDQALGELIRPPSQTAQGTPILSPAEIQAVPAGTPEDLNVLETQETKAPTKTVISPHKPQLEGESIVSTAIQIPNGPPLTGDAWNASHNTMINKAIEAYADDTKALYDNMGFIVQDAEGNQRFASREEALEIARKTGQVDETKLSQNVQGLQSEALKAAATPAQEPTPTEETTPAGRPAAITQDDAAKTLQPFFTQAVETARKAGAIDPESAVSEAMIGLSQQASEGKTTLDNPGALLSEASRRQALKQVQKETASKRGGGTETVELGISGASTPVGPRAKAVSQEDISSIEDAIDAMPDTDRNVMRAMIDDPEASIEQIAAQTNLTPDQVKKAKGRAREALKLLVRSQGIGANLGPGAANIEEVLVRYEERKFGKRFQESKDIEEEIKKATGDRYYEPIPNQVSAEKAAELIETNGPVAIESDIRDDKITLSFTDRSMVGQILIKRYNQDYRKLKDSNPEEAQNVLTKASELSEWLADFGTRLGQGVQSFAAWTRLTPEGKLLTYQRKAKKAQDEYTRNNRNDIDEIKQILNADGTPDQKVQRIKKLKTPTAKKIHGKAGKLVQLLRDGKMTDQKFYEATSSELGLPVFTPEVSREILRLANEVEEAAEGMPKMEKMLALNTYIAQQKGFDPSDLLFGVYYGNILSGTGTHLVNFVDTALNILNEGVTLSIQNPRAAASIWAGFARGAVRGRADLWTAVTKGRKISDGKFVEDPFFMEISNFGKKGGVPLKTDTAFRKVLKRSLETPIAAPLNAWKYVGRLMAASDALAFRSAQEAKASQLAVNIAHNGPQSVSDILGYSRIPEFEAQARSEGYRGTELIARATELMLMSRPPGLQKASTDFAAEGTYNIKPYGVIGSVSNSIEALSRKIPPLKLVVPFTRIVGNVMNRNLNNTPYGYYRAIRGKAGTSLDPTTLKKYSPEERNALLIRATVSTAALSGLAVLHAIGWIVISGAGPADPEKKRQLRQTGWKPYSIKIGDQYWQYNSTPLALGLAVLGNWLDNEKYQDFSSKDGTDKAAYALSAVSGSLLNQSFLSGLGNFWDALAAKNPSEQFSALKRFAGNTVSSTLVPLSSLMKDMENWWGDPNVPKANNLKEALISNIPFASQELKPQLNAFGEPIKSDRSRFLTTQNQDPVWKLIAEKQLRVPVTNNFFDSPDAQYEYVREQGQELRKWFEGNLGRLRNLNTEQAQDAIENASDTFRQRARNRLIRIGEKKKEKAKSG